MSLFEFGEAAVSLFFVISGFVMVYVRVLRLLADSSYSLYLIQFFVINPLHRRLAAWPEWVAVPFTLLCCTAVVIAVYGLVERPLQRMTRPRRRVPALARPVRPPTAEAAPRC